MNHKETKKNNIQKFIYGCRYVIVHNSDDLLTKANKSSKPNDLRRFFWGKCYIVSEAIYYHMGGKQSGYKPMNIKHENTSHWFIMSPLGSIIDETAKQYKTVPDYTKAKCKAFLPTKAKISKRSLVFYNRVIEYLKL